MSETFLLNFMRIACDLTHAERAFALNKDFTVVGTINMAPEQVEVPYIKAIQKAISEDAPTITDSYTMTIDPSKAPVTNQSFPKLRFVVILPVPGVGAVCMDQGLKAGVTSKDKVDRLNRFMRQILASQQTDLDEDELLNAYNAMPD